MIKRILLVLVVLAMPLSACQMGSTDNKMSVGKKKQNFFFLPSHLRYSRKVVSTVHPIFNVYDSDPSFVIYGTGGWSITQVRAKCATFVTAVMNNVYGNGVNINNWLGCSSPNAKTYYDAVIAQNDFQRITNITNVKPGDFIAMDYIPNKCPNHTCGTTGQGCNTSLSGHMGFANTWPVQLQNETINSVTYKVYSVDILDSTQFKHHTADTRHNPNGPDDTGAGIGTMRIYTNNSGTILGYRWSMSNGPFYLNSDNSVNARHIAIGRWDP